MDVLDKPYHGWSQLANASPAFGYVQPFFPSTSATNIQNAESFAPVILRRLAKLDSALEKGSLPVSMQKVKGSSMKEMVKVVLMRPIRMFSEPLVLFTDLFLLYEYTIFFLNFESYPIIFKGMSTWHALLKAHRKLTNSDRYLWYEFGPSSAYASP